MNKNSNKYLITLVVLINLIGHQFAFSQDTTSYKKKIQGYWVSYYGYRQDTIVYVPYNSPLAENISIELKYGGITFKEGFVYHQHLWKMCGNDDGPEFYPGTWGLSNLNNQDILTMTDIDKRTKNYVIVELATDIIVLVPAQ